MANPFRERASEQQRDLFSFLRHFGVAALDLLPEDLWDRTVVIRSAPGGGKTSLMRVFSAESLDLVHRRRGDLEDLAVALTSHGALDSRGPTRVGALVSLDADYKAVADTGLPPAVARQMFVRLLDARVLATYLHSLGRFCGLDMRSDASRLELRPRADSPGARAALLRVGGESASDLLRVSTEVEAQIGSVVESLLPVSQGSWMEGIPELWSFDVIAGCQATLDGNALDVSPLVMFDDGHELSPSQRDFLMDRLGRRLVGLGRWYAERNVALDTQELLAGDVVNRDFVVVDIESLGRARGRAKARIRFSRLVEDIGNRRASNALARYGEGHQAFTDLLESELDGLDARQRTSFDRLLERVTQMASEPRYREWLGAVRHDPTFENAIALRELQIALERDRERPMRELFEIALPESHIERVSGGAIREAATLFLAKEWKAPLYYGRDVVAKLAFNNIEQYLTVAGTLFDAMVAEMTLGRSPMLSPVRQHSIVRRLSDELWREVPRRLPYGRDVVKLLEAIARVAVAETYRPTAPYPPGVTGIALSMADRDLLLREKTRVRLPGGERLYQALGSAIAFNLISADLDQASKGDRVMVLYLNRLLCPRVRLPLGRGGFRERKLAVAASWMVDEDPGPIVDELAFGLGD